MENEVQEKKTSCNTLYRVTWNCPEMGRRQAWFTTHNKAMQFVRKEKINDQAHFENVDIPKKKVDICEWLNQNCT